VSALNFRLHESTRVMYRNGPAGMPNRTPDKIPVDMIVHAITSPMMQRARLILSCSPTPVYRNHQSGMPWDFDVDLHELNGVGVTVQHLQAQWIAEQGRDRMEEPVNMMIRPREEALPRALGL
jgi:hypothetical protein